ncbi:MAG: hypothetical protein AB7O63_09895 [Reyranellaceae bacterium]
MSDPTQQDRRLVRFDPTVTLGHLIQIGAILMPLFVWGVRIETLQAETDVRLGAMQREFDRSEVVLNDRLRSLQATLDRIETKLDGKADKPAPVWKQQ